MTNYLEYLNIPTKISIIIIFVFLVMQIIGEILEFKGKAVPEFLKIRKYIARKKQEREISHQIPITLRKVQETLNEFNAHYNQDNIKKRDKWIDGVNHKLEENDKWIRELDKKMDKNNEDTLSLLIDSKRTQIINFASCVVDEKTPVTREQFNRIFKLYKEYEDIINRNNMTNGEVDIAYRIISDSYENHMRNHSFIEDIRGYDLTTPQNIY